MENNDVSGDLVMHGRPTEETILQEHNVALAFFYPAAFFKIWDVSKGFADAQV